MLKTTTGKSLDEMRKLSRNKFKSDHSFLNYEGYLKFKKNTGLTHVTQKQRSQIIKKVNDLISTTVLKGHYNIRIPNLGIVLLIKFKYYRPGTHGKIKKGDMMPKIHVYFQVTGEEKRVYVLDFDFTAARKYKGILHQNFKELEPLIKQSF
jgi:hypothetical protein